MSAIQKIVFYNFQLKNEVQLPKVELTYQLFGKAIGTAPLIVVNHALTGNSQVAEENGWWQSLIGKEKTIDLNRFSVIAFNIHGNGYGNSENTVENYRDFTNYDIAKMFWKGIDSFKINSIFAVIGGSLGGAIAWEMLAQQPDKINHLIPVATHNIATDWLIGNVLVQDQILNFSQNPIHDARLHAMLLYRTPESLQQKFQGKKQAEHNDLYQIESWLLHHGKKLEARFQLKAYKLMNHLLKTTNVFEKYPNKQALYSSIKGKIHLISVNTDYFFTAKDIRESYTELKENQVEAYYHEIQSIHGHDAFLIEFEQLNKILKPIFN